MSSRLWGTEGGAEGCLSASGDCLLGEGRTGDSRDEVKRLREGVVGRRAGRGAVAYLGVPCWEFVALNLNCGRVADAGELHQLRGPEVTGREREGSCVRAAIR